MTTQSPADAAVRHADGVVFYLAIRRQLASSLSRRDSTRLGEPVAAALGDRTG